MRRILVCLFLSTPAFGQHGVYDHRGQAGDQLGHSLSTLGDIDGDGFEDYAVGAPYGDGLQPGSGYVVFYSGRTGAVIRRIDGEAAGDLFGWSLAGLGGDIDGDQVDDVVIGAPGTNASAGRVYVLSGVDGTAINIWNGGPGLRTGWAVSEMGDANGDQVPDFALSQPSFVGNSGWVAIVSGANSGSLVRHYSGESAGDEFGYSLAPAGDVDGDGLADLVVGAPGYDRFDGTFTYVDAGRAYVVSGGDDQVLFQHTGWVALSAAGTAVAGGEDLDADAVPDIAVGLPGVWGSGAESGRVQVVSGAGVHAVLYQLDGEAAGDHFGAALALTPDSDGDGQGELIVGAPDADSNGNVDAGWAYALSGADGAELYRMNGYFAGDRMGGAVAAARFLNADGAGDVIFGAPQADHPSLGIDSGWARPSLGAAPYPQKYCQAKVNSAGCTPSIGSVGVASSSIADNCHIQATGVLPGKPGMLIWSLVPKASPFYGGTLCVKAPIRRTPVQIAAQVGPGSCDGLYDFHLSHAYMGQKGLTPGSTLHAQYWSRDNGFAAPDGIGLTDGLRVDVLP